MFFYGLVALFAVLGLVLYPHRLSLLHIITGEVFIQTTDCGPLIPPKLNLLSVRDCSESGVDKKVEPCIMRQVVNQSGLDEFIQGMGQEKFPLRRVGYENQRLGNPLHEPVNNFATPDQEQCSLNDIVDNNKVFGIQYWI